MRKFKLLSLLLIAISFVAVNCTKEGPEGPAGATGAQGPSGVAGPTGTTGSANVIYSAWFQFAPTDWADTTIVGSVSNNAPAKRANKAAPGITQAILDQGVVLAYYRFTSTDSPIMLPVTFAGVPTYTLFNIPAVSKLFFIFQRTDAVAGNPLVSSAGFRYVIIPGGVSGGRVMTGAAAGYSVNQLQHMSYDQVATLLNLPADGSNL